MKPIYMAVVLCAVPILLLLFRKFIEARNFQFFGNIVKSVDTDKKIVALTFDDGPNPPYTDQILSILKEYNAKATFFVLGVKLESYKELGLKIVNEGHDLANHSFSHKYLLLRSSRTIKQEIHKTDQIIQQITSKKSSFFRPPFGKKLIFLPWYLRKIGKLTIMCDVDACRAEIVTRDSHKMSEEILKKVKPGSIIMLHDGGGNKSHTVAALSIILKELTRKGYSITSVSGLLKEVGTL
jgi:peptidoglycan/xylan/chitin deacetylase (PgdA/CDA1 family)